MWNKRLFIFLLLLGSMNLLANEESIEESIKILQAHSRHEIFHNIVDEIAKLDMCFDGEKEYVCDKQLFVEYMYCPNLSESDCEKNKFPKADIIYSPSTNWDLRKYTKVNLDLFSHILSIRVPVTKMTESSFQGFYSQKKIKELQLIFNSDWADYKILKSLNFTILPVNDYESIVSNLQKIPSSFTLRGVSEIRSEPDFLIKDKFKVFYDKLIYYPYKTYVYIKHKDNLNAKLFYHRILYMLKSNNHFKQDLISYRLPLPESKSCQLYLSNRDKLLTISKCHLENIHHAIIQERKNGGK